MQTLFLLRHAKSDWNDPSLADHDRPLNDRGRRAAKFMGEFMNESGYHPDLIVCSTAVRTRQTLSLLEPICTEATVVEYDKRIYEASGNTLIYLIAEYADRCEHLLLIGHNPGMEETIYALTARYERMPTAALAVISFDNGNDGSGRLVSIYRPKELMK